MTLGLPQSLPKAAESRQQLLILHLALVGLFLLDLALPRDILLLLYYFLGPEHAGVC